MAPWSKLALSRLFKKSWYVVSIKIVQIYFLDFQVIHNAVEKYNSTYKQHITNFKPLQHKAVQFLLAGRDILCCLPTGYGKSLVYELLPFLFENCFVVIIEPLSIIIKKQEEKLGKKAVCLNKGNYQKDGINFLFSHPEDIDNKEFVDVVCSETFQKKCSSSG